MLVLRHHRRSAAFALITASVLLLVCLLSSAFAAGRLRLPDRPPLPRNYWEVSDFGVHRYEFAGTGLDGAPVVSSRAVRTPFACPTEALHALLPVGSSWGSIMHGQVSAPRVIFMPGSAPTCTCKLCALGRGRQSAAAMLSGSA